MWRNDRALALLKARGRTREWLAKQCRIPLGTLNNILTGRSPNGQVLMLMAKALECTEDFLLGRVEVENLTASMDHAFVAS